MNVLRRVVSGDFGVYATLVESKKDIKKRLFHMMNFKKNSKRIIFISLTAATLLCLAGCAVASLTSISSDKLLNDENFNNAPISDENKLGINKLEAVMTPYNNHDGEENYLWELSATLENGDALTKIYDYSNYYVVEPELYYADLTHDGKDEIILIMPNRTSNYASANIHVLCVDGDGLTELLTILDNPNSQDNPIFVETYKKSLFVIPHIAADENLPMYTPESYETFCTGAVIVQTDDGTELWVRHLMKDSIPFSVIRWDGNAWYVAEQGIHLSPMSAESWVDVYINAMLDAVGDEHRAFTLTDVTGDGIPELFFANFGTGGRWISDGLSYSDGKIMSITIPNGFMQSELELYRNKNSGDLVWIAGDTRKNGYGEYTHEWYIMDFSDLTSVKQDLLFGWIERINDNRIGWKYLFYGSDGTGSYENSVESTLEKLLERQEQFFNAYELMEAAGSFESVISFMNSYDSTNAITFTEDNLNRPLLSMYLSNWRNRTIADKPKNRVPITQYPESSADPTTSPIMVQTWQDAYAEFLRENIPVSEVDFDAFVDGTDEASWFGAFLAGGYPVTPFFYIYDIDNDGIPEMIYIDAANGLNGDVYTYKNDAISKTGRIEFYPFGGLGVPLDKTEGLYSDVGYKGHYGEIYLYTIVNGILVEEMVLEYNNQLELSPSQPGLPYSFDTFASIDYYEVTEENISEVIYRR